MKLGKKIKNYVVVEVKDLGFTVKYLFNLGIFIIRLARIDDHYGKKEILKKIVFLNKFIDFYEKAYTELSDLYLECIIRDVKVSPMLMSGMEASEEAIFNLKQVREELRDELLVA